MHIYTNCDFPELQYTNSQPIRKQEKFQFHSNDRENASRVLTINKKSEKKDFSPRCAKCKKWGTFPNPNPNQSIVFLG